LTLVVGRRSEICGKLNDMRKLLLVIGLTVSFGLTSCKKKVDANENGPCNCGLVLSDNVQNYSVSIRNNCSNNEKTFYLQPGDWMNAYVGQDYCISNVASW
jgi:hypothetical protein